MNVGIAYTIGVKRRFLPGYRKFQCVHHSMDNDGLELHLVDGSAVFLSALVVRGYKVYPNYRVAQEKIKRLAEQVSPKPAPRVPIHDEERVQRDFDEILANVRQSEVSA